MAGAEHNTSKLQGSELSSVLQYMREYRYMESTTRKHFLIRSKLDRAPVGRVTPWWGTRLRDRIIYPSMCLVMPSSLLIASHPSPADCRRVRLFRSCIRPLFTPLVAIPVVQ